LQFFIYYNNIYRRLQGNQNSSVLQIEGYGVLTCISSRLRSAISGCPLPTRTDFGSLDPQFPARPTHLCPTQLAALWPSPRNVLRQRFNSLF